MISSPAISEKRLSLLVMGGGIAGMAFAMRAAGDGHQVTLIEADPDWRVAGAGISITGPTYRALKRLGVLDAVRDEGYFIATGNRICAPDGSAIAETPMVPIAPDLPTAGGILRPRLHAILSDRVRAAGAAVRLGVTVAGLHDDGDRVTARLSDGTDLAGDLAIAADGAFSATRALLFPDAPSPRYTGQYCWRTLAPRPPEIDRAHFFMAHGVTAGLMPVSADQMYLWLLEAAPAKRRIADAEAPAGLRALLAPFGGPLGALRDGLTDASEVNSRPLDALLLPRPWHRGRIVLIGDAVHATTPHLASGAGIAIEDALVLADEIEAGGTPDAIFARFAERRWDRCRLVVENSIAIGALQQQHAAPDTLNALMTRSHHALTADI